METIFVKPKAGLKIRRPDTNSFLSEDGENVPNTTFWQRRLLDKDVELVEAKKEKQELEAKAEDVAAEEKPAKKGSK